MTASQGSLVRILKGSSTARWLSGTTLAEVVAESLNRRLSLKYRTMRLLSRSNHLRSAAIRYYSRGSRPPLNTTGDTVFGSLDTNAIVRELNENGFATGVVLPPTYVAQIMAFCAETAFVADLSKELLIIDMADEGVQLSGELVYRCPNPHKHCEAVDRLIRDPALVAVARGYLQAEPLLHSSQIYWSYPDLSEGYNPVYGFHYDIDDYKFLKLFIYLCDVDWDRGPHLIIEGTHKKKDWFEKGHRRLTDEQAECRYGDRIRVMTGSRGHGFFEDTFCYHKGAKPRKRRLILQLQYAVSDCTLA
jgi:hypothetical protein